MIRRIKTTGVLVTLMALSLPLHAQVKDFSLTQAREYAVEHNYQARNAVIDIAIAAAQIRENIAGGLPQVEASVGYTNFINLATQLIPAEFFGGEPGTFMEVQFGTKNNASAQGQISQLLFNGAYFVGLRVAKEVKLMSELQLEQVQKDVQQAITNAYLLILIAEKNRDLMGDMIQVMELLVKDTRAMYEQGFIQDTDVDKLQLLVSDLKTNLLSAENQVKNAKNLLKFNMGLSVNEEIRLTDNLEMLLVSIDPLGLLAESFNPENHVTMKIMEAQQNITALQVNLAKSAYLPTASMFLSQTENAQRNEFSFFDFDEKWYPTTLFGVQLNIPIFSSGKRMHQVKRANLELTKSMNTRNQVAESLVMGARTSRNNFEVAVQTYRNKKENWILAKRIYEKDQIRYKAGVSSSTDLKQSYNQLLESQGTYLGSVLEMFNMKIELEKAYNKL